MRRLLLTIRYDGTNYCGWQVQPNGVTVQQRMQDAAESVFGARPGITGCSRTDSGVHADMFCCHLDTESAIPAERVPPAMNMYLPRDIAVYGCREVDGDFHARYSCKGKNYIYKMYDSPYRNPFLEGYALQIKRPLDAELMNRAAQSFLGRHDFAGFCSSGSTVEDTVRTVSASSVIRRDDMVVFSVTADGFLYNMVRIMTGTLLAVNEGRIDADDMPGVILSADRNRAGITAPPSGLYLNRVIY